MSAPPRDGGLAAVEQSARMPWPTRRTGGHRACGRQTLAAPPDEVAASVVAVMHTVGSEARVVGWRCGRSIHVSRPPFPEGAWLHAQVAIARIVDAHKPSLQWAHHVHIVLTIEASASYWPAPQGTREDDCHLCCARTAILGGMLSNLPTFGSTTELHPLYCRESADMARMCATG